MSNLARKIHVSEADLDRIVVTSSQLAGVLDVSTKYVADLTRAGVLEPLKKPNGTAVRGRYPLVAVVNPSADEELSKAASREGIHRSVIVERALAKELQVPVNHNDLGFLEKALEHLLSAEKLLASAGAKNP